MLLNYPILQQAAQKLLPALYLIWAGLILGVSFIATPVKFQTPDLTMSVALEVGKVTFHLFNNIELGIIGIGAILTAVLPDIHRKWLVFIGLLVILLAQTFWLLPSLDVRADAVIAGAKLETGYHHWFYIALEMLKLLLALGAAWFYSREAKLCP